MAGGTTFFDLPPEIRNRIYEYCVLYVECTHCRERMYAQAYGEHHKKARDSRRLPWPGPPQLRYHRKQYTFKPSYLSIEGKFFKPPPITQVNRLIRAETLPMWFDQNTFHLGFVYESIGEARLGRSIKHWLAAIGVKAAGMLREISFELLRYVCWDGKRGAEALARLSELGVDLRKVRIRDVHEGNASKLEPQRQLLYG